MTRRPSIPAGAGGLLAALAAERDGNAHPLLVWHLRPRDCLRNALGRWCGDPDVADATLACIVSTAWQAVRAGRRVRGERAWMSGVASRHAAGLALASGRAVALALRYAAGLSGESTEPASADADRDRKRAHVQVLAAIALLPPPHAQTMTLRYVEGLGEPAVARWLMDWNPIGPDGADYILQQGRMLLDFALTTRRHPRSRWPRRYPGNPKWTTTPPPPPRQL